MAKLSVKRNSQSAFVGRGKVEAKTTTMEIFDTLPPAIRNALRSADFNYVTSSTSMRLLSGVSENIIIDNIRRSDLLEREGHAMALIWGAVGHPQAIIKGPTAEDMGL